MTEQGDAAWRMSPATVQDYLSGPASTRFTLGPHVDATLYLDPVKQQVRLYCPSTGELPDVSMYERVTVGRSTLPGRQGSWFELIVDARANHYEAYVLMESIVDQVADAVPFHRAVIDALDSLAKLLAKRARLTPEREAGLIGELLVMKATIGALGEDDAVRSWLGHDESEHDFAFDAFEVEVKTTRSETRRHVIGSETQLEASPDRPLYLVSIQITLAGSAAAGFTLPGLIAGLRNLLPNRRVAFDAGLEGAGWRDEHSDLYRTRFQLRSTPRAFEVDDRFPAITRARIDTVVPAPSRVGGITYRLDLTDLHHSGAPTPLTDFCEGPA